MREVPLRRRRRSYQILQGSEKMSDQMEQLRTIIKEASRIVFFGGAGVSTESGIPDFRSQDGLYHQKWKAPPETILSRDYLMHQTEDFFRFYHEKMLYPNAKPGIVHEKLAQWEKEGKLLSIVTQNIDGLHQMAGNKRVWELHGSVHRNYCLKCGKRYGMDRMLQSDGIPYCDCGGMIRPDVVLYQEGLDEGVLYHAIEDIRSSDLLIVGGTSLTVYPAAGLLRYYSGGPLVLINRSETPYDSAADLVFHESLGEIFSRL